MSDLTRQRLFSPSAAFQEPAVLIIVGAIAAVLILAPALMLALRSAGKLRPELWKELLQRYLSWLAIFAIIVVPMLLGAAVAIPLVTLLSLLCYREFARATGFFRDKAMSLMVVLGTLAVGFAALDHWFGFFVALGPLTVIFIFVVALLADQPRGFIQRTGLAVLSFLLFGVCLGHLAFLANDGRYRSLLLLLLATVALNDVFAFCVGRTLGGPKLAPNASPNKTISGAAGAVILSTLLFLGLSHVALAGTPVHHLGHRVALGIIISLAGICGDLVISSVKRDVGLKDMGTLLPGHGGVLDRCNSLLLAAPAVFHYLKYFASVGDGQATRIFTLGGG